MIQFFTMFMLAATGFTQEITPTKKFSGKVVFTDDLDLAQIETAIDRQLRVYDRPGHLRGTIRFGADIYEKTTLRDSLIDLKALAAEYKTCLSAEEKEICSTELNRKLHLNFITYVPNVKAATKTRFTAYYSPDLRGSRIQTERFSRPVFAQPPTDLARSFTRVEIDHDEKLSGKGLELFWVENSFFDLYLLHVQGGGRVTIEESSGETSLRYLSMTGANGKKCEFIGEQMARMGWVPKPEALRVSRQREFLEQNPEKTREAFRFCQNYIYFRESTEEPVGRNNIPLTSGRSIAIDHTLYPTTGLVTFVKVKKADGKNISRFFVAQDTGSKIRGPARSDLYMGYGLEAEQTAYSLNTSGEQYFLIRRKK
jgi:membrane-bound lytic murein transglycosylase